MGGMGNMGGMGSIGRMGSIHWASHAQNQSGLGLWEKACQGALVPRSTPKQAQQGLHDPAFVASL